MKKVQHQTSSYAKKDSAVPQTTEPTANHKIQLPLASNSSDVKNLYTKLFLLEKRAKSITHFYQQKMTQLKQVIKKQHQTKTQLTRQLSRLTKQSLRQISIIATLKNNLSDAEDLKQSNKIRLSSNLLDGSPQKMAPKRSRSKGKANPIFSSTRLTLNIEKFLLKKTKSSHNIQSYYYLGQTEAIVNARKPAKDNLNKFCQ